MTWLGYDPRDGGLNATGMCDVTNNSDVERCCYSGKDGIMRTGTDDDKDGIMLDGASDTGSKQQRQPCCLVRCKVLLFVFVVSFTLLVVIAVTVRRSRQKTGSTSSSYVQLESAPQELASWCSASDRASDEYASCLASCQRAECCRAPAQRHDATEVSSCLDPANPGIQDVCAGYEAACGAVLNDGGNEQDSDSGGHPVDEHYNGAAGNASDSDLEGDQDSASGGHPVDEHYNGDGSGNDPDSDSNGDQDSSGGHPVDEHYNGGGGE
jgi:hypothetical protein